MSSIIEITTTGQSEVEVTTTANSMSVEVLNTQAVYEVEVQGLLPTTIINNGGGGSSDRIYGEILTSLTTTFNVSQNFVTGTTALYLNGQRLARGGSRDYVEVGTSAVLYNFTLTSTDLIEIDYNIQI